MWCPSSHATLTSPISYFTRSQNSTITSLKFLLNTFIERVLQLVLYKVLFITYEGLEPGTMLSEGLSYPSKFRPAFKSCRRRPFLSATCVRGSTDWWGLERGGSSPSWPSRLGMPSLGKPFLPGLFLAFHQPLKTELFKLVVYPLVRIDF